MVFFLRNKICPFLKYWNKYNLLFQTYTKFLINHLVFMNRDKQIIKHWFTVILFLVIVRCSTHHHRSSLHWLAALKCRPTHTSIINFVANIQSIYINVVTTLIPPRTFVVGGTIHTFVRIIVSVFSTEGFPLWGAILSPVEK